MGTWVLHFAYCPSIAFLADLHTKRSEDELTNVLYSHAHCKVTDAQIRL